MIDDSTLFQIRVTLAGKRSELYAGRFTLAEGMSYGDAIDALSEPPAKTHDHGDDPRGLQPPQAAQLVEEDGVPGNYMKATVKSKYLDPAEYGGKGAKDLEGFLFPDTFELKPDAPSPTWSSCSCRTSSRKSRSVNMKYAKSKNLTVFDVVTIASMIEDEAGVPNQRKLVASVIYNRLHEGMPLGIDATIRFATGNYTEPLTESELAVDSPYNTCTNAGLPPGPINSPGLGRDRGRRPPGEDRLPLLRQQAGHLQRTRLRQDRSRIRSRRRKYKKAREANGGNAPSTCGE